MSSGNLRPAAAVVVSVIVTSAGIWYIHKTQTWEREVPHGTCADPMHPLQPTCAGRTCSRVESGAMHTKLLHVRSDEVSWCISSQPWRQGAENSD